MGTNTSVRCIWEVFWLYEELHPYEKINKLLPTVNLELWHVLWKGWIHYALNNYLQDSHFLNTSTLKKTHSDYWATGGNNDWKASLSVPVGNWFNFNLASLLGNFAIKG